MPKPNIPPAELATWVRDAWDTGPDTDERTVWTQHFNDRLAIRVPSGITAFGSGLGRNSQYLVDHCWSAPWTGMSSYSGLELAAEFEWGGTRGAVEEDLIKLADIRAKARLFVGNLWGSEWCKTAQEIADATVAMLSKHDFARDDTIVLALGPKGKRAECKEDIRVWAVTSNSASSL